MNRLQRIVLLATLSAAAVAARADSVSMDCTAAVNLGHASVGGARERVEEYLELHARAVESGRLPLGPLPAASARAN
jgi:3-dehydroquinate synthetase